METKFTQGKWFLELSDGTIRSKAWGQSDQMGDYRGVIICDLTPGLGADDFSKESGREHARPETLANAKLISNAPDLFNSLESLTGILNWMQEHLTESGRNELLKAIDVIEKIEA
jgi:hypothetical protein